MAASISPLGLRSASRIKTSLNRVEPEKSALREASEKIFKTQKKKSYLLKKDAKFSEYNFSFLNKYSTR